jgi:dTDP-4-amino-4,6-dideoxygalactose transaminase
MQAAYRNHPSAAVRLPVTESQAQRTLALPFFNRIKSAQIAEVCAALLDALRHIG